MLLRLFKGTTPGVIFLIVLTLIALWAGAFLKTSPVDATVYNADPMPLYGLLIKIFGSSHFLSVAFSFSMVSVIALLVVRFNSNIFFIKERTYLPALIYILFSCIFPQNQILNPALPASVLLMFAIIRIMDAYRKPGTAYSFFDAGILIGIGSLIYANLIWFGILIIIGIILIRTTTLNEIAISFIGLITPYIFTFGFYYVLGKDFNSFLLLFENNLFESAEDYVFTQVTIVVMILTGLLELLSIGYLILIMNTKKIKSRKTFILLIWLLIISIGVYFIMPSVSVEIASITAIPASYFLVHYFVFIRKKIVPEVIFALLFIIVLLTQIWHLV